MRKTVTIAVILFIILAALGYLIRIDTLIVKINGKEVFVQPVESKTMHIRYYHSVSKTFIDEYYYLNTKNDMIITKKSIFSSQGGAGLPEYGKLKYAKDGRFEMEMSRPIQRLFITVQHQYPGFFYYENKILNLPSYTDSYAQAEVFLTKTAISDYIAKKVKIYERERKKR